MSAKILSLSGAGLRVPPQNIDAERALLGAILANNRAFESVSEFLVAEHFSDPPCAVVFDSIAKLLAKGAPATIISLKTYLENNETIKAVGGIQFLTALQSMVVTTINAKEYGRIIRDCFLRRELIGIGEQIVNEAHTPDVTADAGSQIEAAEQELFNLAARGYHESGPRKFVDILHSAIAMAERAMKHRGAISGVSTGLTDLDSQLGGLHPSDLVILAARPGMGKTALAMHIALAAAKPGGKPVLFFSLEMGAEQLGQRVLAEAAMVDSHRLRTGRMTNADFDNVVAGVIAVHEKPLIVDDTAGLTMPAVRTRARRVARKNGGIELIVIDYLQLIEALRSGSDMNRVQELTAITRGLKALAKEFNCPVLALSQLNRAVETREDKRPRLADLRDSGSIEQDADVVLMLYREEYYAKDETPEDEKHVAEIDVAKQRHGPTGVVRVYFDAVHTAFRNLGHDQN